MSRKHYKIIASVIARSNDRYNIAQAMATALAAVCKGFDKEKFIAACNSTN